jgi:hypothetical protein
MELEKKPFCSGKIKSKRSQAKLITVILILGALLSQRGLSEITEEDKFSFDVNGIPIATIEATHRNVVKSGLATLVTPTAAITSRHIVDGANEIKIIFDREERIATGLQNLKGREQKDLLDPLTDDVILVNWLSPIKKEINFPKLSTKPPKKGQNIRIPKHGKNNKLFWESRYISGLDSHTSWSGLPKPLYKTILWLNNERINSGTDFEIGDSGGPWISSEREIIAITSRIDDGRLSPHTQTTYATNIKVGYNNSKDTKQSLAWRPMFVATFILFFAWGLSQFRNNNPNPTI